MTATFLGIHTGSFSTPAAGNPTVVMVEAAYRHHGLDARYLNCEVPPAALADAVAGARAMGWAGVNCSSSRTNSAGSACASSIALVMSSPAE